jgi:hypothetical protein
MNDWKDPGRGQGRAPASERIYQIYSMLMSYLNGNR